MITLSFGVNGFNWIRFRRVNLPLPSTLIRYCRKGRTSLMMPVFSHRVGERPSPFWISTCWPQDSGGSCLLLLLTSALLTIFSAMVFSRASLSSFHLGNTGY